MRVSMLSLSLAALFTSPLAWSVLNQGVELTDRYIVVLKQNTSADQAEEVLAAINHQRGKVRFRYQHTIRGFAVQIPFAALQGLQHRLMAIDYIEPDLLVQALPGKPDKGGSDSNSGLQDVTENGQTIPWGVQRLGRYDSANLSDLSGSGHRAWVLDTGVDVTHSDLNVDISNATSYIDGQSATLDGNGHGTHVAGTIGAIDNSQDVVGLAPGITIVPVKVLSDSGSGSLSGVIAGVDYVAGRATPGDCANLSLGAMGSSQAMDTALKEAALTVYFAIAAGNSGADIDRYTPAQVQADNVFTVAAIDAGDKPPRWSNYSTSGSTYGADNQTTWVEYALPGVNVISTRAGGGTITYSGTSMAAPHLCGLILSGVDPQVATQQIENKFKQYGGVLTR